MNERDFFNKLYSVFNVIDIPDGSGIELELNDEYIDMCNEVQLGGIEKYMYKLEDYVNDTRHIRDNWRWGIKILDQIIDFRK